MKMASVMALKETTGMATWVLTSIGWKGLKATVITKKASPKKTLSKGEVFFETKVTIQAPRATGKAMKGCWLKSLMEINILAPG